MNPIKVIYLKEVREMLRDKRVRQSAVFGPMFMIAMMMVLFGFLFSAIGERSNVKIHVVGGDNSMVKEMRAAKMDVQKVDTMEQGRALIKDGKARVVLQFEKDYDQKLAAHEPTKVQALYNPSEQVSQIAMAAMKEIFTQANKVNRDALLTSKGISQDQAEPIKVDAQEVVVGQNKGNDILVGFLPYLIVIWAFYGGMSIVSDLVAGEKEKNTLETLLIAPVKRYQVALGKFFALGSVCLVSSMSSVAGVYIMAALHLPITKKVFEGGVGVTPQAAGVILLVMVPTVALFASIMIAVSTYARNARESQSYLTLVSFLVLMPAISSQFIGFTDAGSSRWVNFVPVLNAANTIRQSMFGKFDWSGIAITVAVGLAIALIAMRVAVQLFNREEVLTRV